MSTFGGDGTTHGETHHIEFGSATYERYSTSITIISQISTVQHEEATFHGTTYNEIYGGFDYTSGRSFVSVEASYTNPEATGGNTTAETTFSSSVSRTIGLAISTVVTLSSALLTSAIISTETTVYTSTAGNITTTTKTANITSNVATVVVEDEEETFIDLQGATISTVFTTVSNSFTTQSLSAAAVIGTVVSAENEWLWIFTDTPNLAQVSVFNSEADFLTNCAISTSRATLWEVFDTETVEYFTYGEAMPPTASFSNAAHKTTFSTENVTAATFSYLRTTGSKLPRETTTGLNFSTGKSVRTFVGGFDSNGFTGLTFTNVSTTAVISSTTSHLTNATDTVIVATTAIYSYNKKVPVVDQYQASSSRSALTIGTNGETQGLSYSSFERGVSSTRLYTMNVGKQTRAGSVSFWHRLPEQGGVKLPGAMKQSNTAGTNVGFPATIYYPFFSSVQHNVVVPVRIKTSAVESSSKTWRYSWSSSSLFWTSKNSSTSASGSGAVTLVGNANGTSWGGGGNYFGGFSPVSTASEFAFFTPAGRKATIYGTSGGTSTARTLRSNQEVSSTSEVLHIETSLPIVRTYVYSPVGEVGHAAADFTTFTRNG